MNIAYNAVLGVSFSFEDAVEPVTLDEVKSWCRIDVPDDDLLLTDLITAARQACEEFCNISFINRTVTARLNNGLGGMYLPYGPVTGEITSITDEDGVDIDTRNFSIKNTAFLQLFSPHDNIVTVVYNTGYADGLPKSLKLGLLQQIAWMYDNRSTNEIGDSAKMILQRSRRI